MLEKKFLLVRLGSLGDVVHALPAASALRDTFPAARIDWVIDAKWRRVLEGNPDISNLIVVERKTARGVFAVVNKLRAVRYDCAIDFQALYKSALLPFCSRIPRRIGFKSSYAREGLAAMFYTERFNPRGAHKIEHNLALAEHAGAQIEWWNHERVRFPLTVCPEDEQLVSSELAALGLGEFYVLNPGGGWRSKCWPAERYGELHLRLYTERGWRGVLTYGPGEENLAERAQMAAGESPLTPMDLRLGPLMALMRRAAFVVSADTGPLHLASALGAPCVGLFGPTDPSRNGPYGSRDVSLRNPSRAITSYRRGKQYADSMLSITVAQVVEAIDQRLR